MYLPVRVSILIFSPVLMKSGAWTVMPVSRVIAFWTLLAESPRTPSGASVTVRTTLDGSSMDYAGRQFDGRNLLFNEGDRYRRVLREVILHVAYHLGRHRYGFVGLRVGKDVIVAVLVAEFHLAGDHRNHIDFFGRAEADVRGLARADAADGHLHEGAQVARSAVLRIKHYRDVAIVTNGHSFSNIVG
jgi:hypothetical protein